MERYQKTTRYLVGSTGVMLLIGFIAILGNVLINDVVYYFNHRGGLGMTRISNETEGTAAVMLLLMGLIFFTSQFKAILANGVSRKTLFWGMVSAFVINSAVFALFISLVTLAHLPFVSMILASQTAYAGSGLLDVTVFQFSLYFMLAILGWMVHLAYYRSNIAMRWVISLAPFVLIALLITWNSQSSGAVAQGLGDLFTSLMGFSGATPNPYIAALSLLFMAAVLCGVNYLLLKRAELKA
jgi:hypothetical protein